LLLLFTAFRFLTLFLLRPGGFIYDYSDYHFFEAFASFSDEGFYPFVHYWMEYPPIFPWMAVLAYRLSLRFPLWVDPRLAFYSLVGLELLPFEVGNLTLIYLIARRLRGQNVALRSAWIYALLFIPVYTWTGWFDTMPLFFLLATIYFLFDRRALAAGVALGLGFMSKATPAIAGPIGWAVLSAPRPGRKLAWLWPSRENLRFVAAFAATALLIAAPFLWLNPLLLLAGFRSMFGRSSWETVYALLDGYYGYGLLGGDRFDPHPTFTTHPTSLPWPLITAAFALLYLALFLRQRNWRAPRTIVSFSGLTVTLFLLYSKGYSPQFLVWLLPFLAVLLPDWRGVGYALLLSSANIVEWVIYFIVFPREHTLFATVVLLRTALIAAVAVEFAVQYLDVGGRLARVRRGLFFGLTATFVLLCLIGLPYLGRNYATARAEASPYAESLSVLRGRAAPGAIILLTDDDAYRQLYPFLWREHTLRVVREGSDLSPLLADQHEVWLVRRATPGDDRLAADIQARLQSYFWPAEPITTPRLRLIRYVRRKTGAVSTPPPAAATR